MYKRQLYYSYQILILNIHNNHVLYDTWFARREKTEQKQDSKQSFDTWKLYYTLKNYLKYSLSSTVQSFGLRPVLANTHASYEYFSLKENKHIIPVSYTHLDVYKRQILYK